MVNIKQKRNWRVRVVDELPPSYLVVNPGFAVHSSLENEEGALHPVSHSGDSPFIINRSNDPSNRFIRKVTKTENACIKAEARP